MIYKHRFTICFVLAAFVIFGAIRVFVYQIGHPDLTQFRIMLDMWVWYLIIFIPLILMALLTIVEKPKGK